MDSVHDEHRGIGVQPGGESDQARGPPLERSGASALDDDRLPQDLPSGDVDEHVASIPALPSKTAPSIPSCRISVDQCHHVTSGQAQILNNMNQGCLDIFFHHDLSYVPMGDGGNFGRKACSAGTEKRQIPVLRSRDMRLGIADT